MNDIILSHIGKEYGGRAVLQNLSVQFPGGGISAITGPSGCGKTTLLRILLGLEKPDRGSISGCGDACAAVFQEDRLCEDFSAQTNVRLALPKNIPQEEILRCLTDLGLPQEQLHEPVRQFSGGMKRRVAIARALLSDSKCWIMDEPLKGLDDETRLHTVHCILKRRAGRTLIFVTHDPQELELLNAQTILPL